MSYRIYNFECPCGHEYECLVDGVDGAPDPCPKCDSTKAKKIMSRGHVFKVNIPDYPGAKRHMAGYAAELRRPAEKAGRQISMGGLSVPGTKR